MQGNNMDKNLSSVIKFLDDTGSISDAEISNIAKQLKFSEVLDLVGFVGKGDTQAAKAIVAKYDDRFTSATPQEEPAEESITNEYSSIPPVPPTSTSGFKPIAPKQAGTQQKPSPTATGQQQPGQNFDDNEDLQNALDGAEQAGHTAEVNQIRSLLQRITNR
jgi:hypothetical protein